MPNLGLKKTKTEDNKSSFDNLFFNKMLDNRFLNDLEGWRAKFEQLEFSEDDEKVKFDFESETGN